MEAIIARAKQDLAGRVSTPLDRIEVLEIKAVVWPDAGLGCPQPGMRYKQVPVDGALIRLRAEGQVYEYHGGGRRGLFLCQPQPGPQKNTPDRGGEPPPRSPDI